MRYTDLVVDGKTVKSLISECHAKILNYLRITGYARGLRISYGSCKFEIRARAPDFYNSTTLHG